ncbi:MAG TPA: periplasmic heavy metal sensor [Rickettsiales bacterium]|nr:periplasmic heavy metal sensor [Rickettsiales bacterium]
MNHRILKFFLAISLLGNLLMLGMVFGHTGRDFLSCNEHHHINLMEMAAFLSPQAQQQLHGRIAADQKDLDNQRQQLHNERLQAIAALDAKPFNKDAYDQHTKALADIHVKISQDVSDALAAIATQCDDAQRARLVETLRSRLENK